MTQCTASRGLFPTPRVAIRGAQRLRVASIGAAVCGFIALMTAAAPVLADAAVKAQEGSIEHWIDYYTRERGASKPAAPQPAPPADKSSAPAAETATETKK